MMAITPAIIHTVFIVPANIVIVLSPISEQMPLRAFFTVLKVFISVTILLCNDFGFDETIREGSDEQRFLLSLRTEVEGGGYSNIRSDISLYLKM